MIAFISSGKTTLTKKFPPVCGGMHKLGLEVFNITEGMRKLDDRREIVTVTEAIHTSRVSVTWVWMPPMSATSAGTPI